MMPRTANISGRSRRLSLYRRRQSTTRAMTSGDDIGRILVGPFQQGAGALIELLAARTAPEPAIALGGALGSLRHGFRSAFQAPHPRPPRRERRAYTPPSPCWPGTVARALTEPLAEAKSEGFDVKVLKEIIRLRKQDRDERDERETLLDVYMRALDTAPPAAEPETAAPRAEAALVRCCPADASGSVGRGGEGPLP